MTRLRVVLITRWFWPLADDVERTIARLATGLHERGVVVTLLTARGSSNWPARVDYQDLPVLRLPHPHRERWRRLWYLLALGRWLRRQRGTFDVICVSHLRSEACAVLRAMRRTGVPVVLRAETSGLQGDCQWQERARFGGRVRRRCHAAEAIVVPDAAIERELLRAGYADERLVRIANGVTAPAQQDPEGRARVRAALADANPDLNVALESPLAVYAGRPSDRTGIRWLLQAWRQVVRRWPSAKLWLVGDGPGRDVLWDDIGQWNLQSHVVLPGLFDDLGDVLQAADLYVDPLSEFGLPTPLLDALATGVPVVAARTRAPLLAACGAVEPALFRPEDATDLADTIGRVLAARPTAEVLSQTRAGVLARHDVGRMVDEHVSLFERLVSAR